MLAEQGVAGKRAGMRRIFALLLVPALSLAPAACRDQPQGAIKAVVIGGEPKLRDPTLGPLPPVDSVLLQNVAQGLVRFDSTGNIVGGLAERWNVSDDGLSYIFRLAATDWPDGKKVTAQQVARLLKREIAPRSRNPLKDAVGAVDDIVAMTDRVIEIRLLAPRPNLLSLLAQPEFAILRDRDSTGPFKVTTAGTAGELRLTREINLGDEEQSRREEVLLAGASVADAIRDFAGNKVDLVLGGGFADLPLAQRVKLPRNALRFDPASGLFGLVPARSGGPLDNPDVRRLLAQALDRANFIDALGVPGLAARATLLEAGLDGIPAPVSPAWLGTPLGDRLPALKTQAQRTFGAGKPVVIRVALPGGPGGDLLLQELVRDWSAIGVTVERAAPDMPADLALIDEVAPSSSPAWFVRHFRCGQVPVCDPQADEIMDAARMTQIGAQRFALLAEAAARIDEAQLFIPITAPVRWSLVSGRIQGFAGNRYARHTLTDLEQQSGGN